MKILSAEECKQYAVGRQGRKTEVFEKISALQPGEGLLIEKNDWKKKYPPMAVSARIARLTGKKFTGGRKLGGTGWLIQRMS